MDAALFFETIAGPDRADLVTLGQPDTGVVRWINRDVKQLCVGLVRDPFFEGADPQVVEAVEKAALVLESLGVHVVEMAFPEAREELNDELEGRGSLMIMPVEGMASHRDMVVKHGAEIASHIKDRLLKGQDFSAVDYAMALQKCTRLRQSAKETLRDVDAIICPTMLTTAPRRDTVDAIPIRLTTRLVNFLGLCAVSLPCGWDKNGLPIGLQLIGKPFDEATVLRLAHAFESATNWHKKCPPGF
jgi:aspartyl-tRNA(Asn)/glutamyl-tRNA(Gln) amidotransferase subunit A